MRMHVRPSRAIGLLAIMTIVVIAVAVTFLLLDMRKRQLDAERLDTLGFSHQIREETERSFDGLDLLLRGVQERMQTVYGGTLALDSAAVRLLLVARISGMPQVRSLFLLDASGVMVNSSRTEDILGAAYTDQEYFKAFADRAMEDLFVGKPQRDTVGPGWILHVARPFSGRDGKFRGIAVATLDLAHLEALYKSKKPDRPRPVSLYLSDGTLVAGLPHRDNLIGEYAPELGNGLPEFGGDLRIVDQPSGDGGVQALALGRAGRFPLLVGVSHDPEMALAEWRENATVVVLGAALVCSLVATAAGLLMHGVARQAGLARALRDANNRYHQTINSVMDAIVAVDESRRIILFNPAAERMFGLSQAQALGLLLERLLPDSADAAHALNIERFKAAAGNASAAASIEVTGRHASGNEFPVECTMSHTLVEAKPQFTAVVRDNTLRRRAEEDLREMNRQLRSLSASLQQVREQERTRIAMELHDDLGQQLTGLKLELSWLGARLKEGRKITAQEVLAMRQLLDAALASVRRIATDLRPVILDDLGFGDAVAWHTAEFTKRSGLEVMLDLQAQELVKDDVLATALFRILQESLTNVVRHAGAKEVKVRLTADEKELMLTVCDDGSGLTGSPRPGSGMGLVSMRERAAALGGRLQISGVPGVGTTIAVALPLQRPAVQREAA